MKPTHHIPDDPGIPGLAAIRAGALARTIPECSTHPVDLRLVGHTRGQRATLEARVGSRRVAIKCYAKDPRGEASVYRALAVAGLASGGSRVRVPQLLAMDEDLRMMAISWLEGPTARELLARNQGERSGRLAARWLRCSALLEIGIGPAFDVQGLLGHARAWVAALGTADASLGAAAEALTERMAEAVPSASYRHLVHGRLYIRHLLDLGDACGLIDWERYGQGPLEVDAGMYLATLWRSGQKEYLAHESRRAEASFREATADLLDESRLAWYRAGALLSLAHHQLARSGSDWQARAHAILLEARRGLETGWPVGADRVAVLVPEFDPSSADAGTTTVPWTLAWAMDSGEGPERPVPAGPPLALLQVLWNRDEVTAEEVTRQLDRSLDPSAVETLLTQLERRGIVTHRVAGRRSVYRAKVGRAEARQSFVEEVATFADELFDGDTAALVCQLVQARDVSSGDLAEMIALLQARERELEGGQP
jgi:predicted transcriptional regulator